MGSHNYIYLEEVIGKYERDLLIRIKTVLLEGKTIVIPEYGEIRLSWRYSKAPQMKERKVTPKIVTAMDTCFFEKATEVIKAKIEE